MPSTDNNKSPSQHASVSTWQYRLLPLMAGLLITLAAFFFAASLYLVLDMKTRITSPPEVPQGDLLRVLEPGGGNATMGALLLLEENALARRYHQANISLMARLWTRYLGFITGMILSFVGAAFILGKMREARADLAAEGAFGKLSLSTHSPGLLMVAMGTILMLTTILNHPRIDIVDAPVYLGTAEAIQPMAAKPKPAAWTDSTMQKPTEPATVENNGDGKVTTDPALDQLMEEMKKKVGPQLE
jgi:hypothetical protein